MWIQCFRHNTNGNMAIFVYTMELVVFAARNTADYGYDEFLKYALCKIKLLVCMWKIHHPVALMPLHRRQIKRTGGPMALLACVFLYNCYTPTTQSRMTVLRMDFRALIHNKIINKISAFMCVCALLRELEK